MPDISTRLRKITQTVRGIGTPPATIDAVDEITLLLAHLFDRVAELEKCKCQDHSSSQVEIFIAPKVTEKDPESLESSGSSKDESSKELRPSENDQKSFVDDGSSDVSVSDVQEGVRCKPGTGEVQQPKLPKPKAKRANPQNKSTSSKTKKEK